jgi:hypothetical protein
MATEQTHQGAAEASGNRQEDVWLCVCVSPLACARWQTDVDCISLRSATFLASLTRQSTSPEPDVRSHKAIHVCALVPPVVVAASIHTNFPTLPYLTKQNKTKLICTQSLRWGDKNYMCVRYLNRSTTWQRYYCHLRNHELHLLDVDAVCSR